MVGASQVRAHHLPLEASNAQRRERRPGRVGQGRSHAHRRDDQYLDQLPGGQSPGFRQLPHVPGGGPLAHGRERRWQVDAHQGTHRCLRYRLRHDDPRRREAGHQRTSPGAGRGHQHRLPGGQPPAQPLRRREHHARPRTPPPRRHRLAGNAGSRCRAAAAAAPHRGPGVASELTLARRAAARRDCPRHRCRCQGAHS